MAESLQTSTAASSTGLEPNVAAALSYAFAPIGGIVFYVLEKENAHVRFHAAQSIVFGCAAVAISLVLNFALAILGHIPGVGFVAALLSIPVWLVIGLAELYFWVMAVVRAYGGTEYEIPVVGTQARKYLLGAPAA